jgi:Flp pilus assembly protein TadD
MKANNYEKARKAHDQACEVFQKFRKAYRNLEIGDAEFLAAKADFDKATSAFNEAYASAGGAA